MPVWRSGLVNGFCTWRGEGNWGACRDGEVGGQRELRLRTCIERGGEVLTGMVGGVGGMVVGRCQLNGGVASV